MTAKLALRYAIREALGLIVMGAALFWPVGTINWWPAWASLAVMAAWIITTAVVIFRFNPALLAERLGPRKGSKPWDTAIMSFLGLAQLARYITAGLDHRFGWTGDFSLAAQIVALILGAAGYALVVWATASNPFFSQIVQIQSERGHRVVSDGPYRCIRHPAYFGATLYEGMSPILLASWWAFVFSVLSISLIVLRTVLEDCTLRTELAGYVDYARRVRFCLLPGIW